jgi:cyclopropane-fatty-acyl-phospholipid synthase
MSFRRETLRFLCSRLAPAAELPPLRLVFWDGESFDVAPQPKVTMTLGSPRLLGALIRGDFNELAKAYLGGDIAVEGPIDEVAQTGIALAERLDRSPTLRGLRRVAAMLRLGRRRPDDDSLTRYRYDASNEFYRLWLDERMIYSCAYFRSGTEDIDTAQAQKLEHICRKLLLQPGERLLDVGCGWGGLLQWAAERRRVSGLGVTLSERQWFYARERLADKRIEIRLQSYRDLREAGFDKVVSVDMYEHVGSRNLPAYFQKMAGLLRPGGAFLNQGIVTVDLGGAQGAGRRDFLETYLFPGGAVSPLSRVILEIADAGLEVLDVEDLRPHYVRTLASWSERLEAHREEAIRTGGLERYRLWRLYLAGMAQAFERGWLSVVQILAYKPGEKGLAPRPWTRDYQYRDYQYNVEAAPPPLTGDIGTSREAARTPNATVTPTR